MKQNSFLILLMISACLINSGCRKVDPVEGDSITENDSDALIVSILLATVKLMNRQ